MPWSNQGGGSGGGGGWKSGGGGGGGGGPWGQGPAGGGGGGQQPDLEELLKRSQDRMKQVMGGGTGLSGGALSLIILAALAEGIENGLPHTKLRQIALSEGMVELAAAGIASVASSPTITQILELIAVRPPVRH